MSLATLLLESFDDEPGLDSALLTELKQRAADLRSGKLKGTHLRRRVSLSAHHFVTQTLTQRLHQFTAIAHPGVVEAERQ